MRFTKILDEGKFSIGTTDEKVRAEIHKHLVDFAKVCDGIAQNEFKTITEYKDLEKKHNEFIEVGTKKELTTLWKENNGIDSAFDDIYDKFKQVDPKERATFMDNLKKNKSYLFNATNKDNLDKQKSGENEKKDNNEEIIF